MNGYPKLPIPLNEPVKNYAPGSAERAAILAAIEDASTNPVDVPIVIGGKAVYTDEKIEIQCPHNHTLSLGVYSSATAEHAKQAIAAALKARSAWQDMPWEARAAIFLKAADLAAGPWRQRLNAATVLGQGKTVYQAEIDSACEWVDFLRFNADFARQIYSEQPVSSPEVWNQVEYRPLDGFVFAVTPFNFTAIAGNLPAAAALMGNTVVWKPSERSVLSAHVIMELFYEAGLPDGVINFLPTADPAAVGDVVLNNEHMAGIHFTGSTRTFQMMWRKVAENIGHYKSYPRLVGETGGKDFVFAHSSAAPQALVTGLIRGAFEYQGQKCSAASRAYIPASLWDEVTQGLKEQVAGVAVGPPTDLRNFVGAVIDRRAFDEIGAYIDFARQDPGHEILVGGERNDKEGFFIKPTVVIASDPRSKLMTEEIFGPVLTLYKYEDDELESALDVVDQSCDYALTGAIFARDRAVINHLANRLRHSAGKFYINDKPTGAVVGQQPFGGGRKSGTNDKAGSALNLIRWCSARTIKETMVSATDYRYPFMQEESKD